MTRSQGPEGRSRKFEDIYTGSYREIAGYVRRRVAPDAVDDVIAHIYAVAWRRFDRVPPPPQDRLWLFGVARNCVADHRRTEQRQLRLRARLSADALTAACTVTEPDSRHEPIRAAINALQPRDREALQLVLWEDLSHEEAAAVLGCSVNAFESRYRRARNCVREAVTSAQPATETASARLIRKPTTSRTYPS